MNVSESSVVNRKKDLFDEVENIIQNFTPYERWLYYDMEDSGSYPKAGSNLAQIPPVSGSFNTSSFTTITGNAEVLRDYQGLDVAYKISTNGNNIITGSKFSIADNPVGTWDTGSSSEPYWDITSSRMFYAPNRGGGASGDTHFTFADGYSSLSNDGVKYQIRFSVANFESQGGLTIELGINNGANSIIDFNNTEGAEGNVISTGTQYTHTTEEPIYFPRNEDGEVDEE